MRKPPRGIGIPKCTCTADPTSNEITKEADPNTCNYHHKSSANARAKIEQDRWNPNA